MGAQIILAATCTMGDRYDMYIPEFRTIALETHTFLAASNRAGYEQVEGEEEPRHHFGLSSVINPIGTVLDTTDDTPWTYVCGEFDTEKLTSAFYEAGGIYPEYEYNQNMDDIEKNMNAVGY